jgi:hypothetical protein
LAIPFVARVRYFDDLVNKTLDKDMEQVVILGAERSQDLLAHMLLHNKPFIE